MKFIHCRARAFAVAASALTMLTPGGFGAINRLPLSAWQQLDGAAIELQVPPAQAAPAQELKFAKQPPKQSKDARLFEKTFRSVVTIMVKNGDKRLSSGTGFIIDASGLVLTNQPVVKPRQRIPFNFGAPPPMPAVNINNKIFVFFYEKAEDGRVVKVDELEADLVGFDEERDIAVLRVNAGKPLPALELQTEVGIGESVWAIGAPFGFEQSFSKGIVSGLGRVLGGGSVIPAIQTTAAINPGNSGGPLINREGQVVGINSMIYSRVGENNGLAFSLPIGKVKPYIEQLIATGKTTLGTIQIDFNEGSVRTAAGAYGYSAVISSVVAGGVADQAGLKAGDIVVSINGKTLKDLSDVLDAITGAPPGSVLSLGVQRAGQSLAIDVKVVDARAPQAAGAP